MKFITHQHTSIAMPSQVRNGETSHVSRLLYYVCFSLLNFFILLGLVPFYPFDALFH
jgi:hypothetical protein